MQDWFTLNWYWSNKVVPARDYALSKLTGFHNINDDLVRKISGEWKENVNKVDIPLGDNLIVQ